jgi:hypothetical protein
MNNDVYQELVADIMSWGEVDRETATAIMQFLDAEGLVDYDTLKEYYAYDDEA